MIDVKDVRIGNLISVDDKICTISRIDLFHKFISAYPLDSKPHILHGLKDVSGIPLSEEWLVKLGFNKLYQFNNTWGKGNNVTFFDFIIGKNNVDEFNNARIGFDFSDNNPQQKLFNASQYCLIAKTAEGIIMDYKPIPEPGTKEYEELPSSVFQSIINRKPYVHWLQNWYYFNTGQELTIKEGK